MWCDWPSLQSWWNMLPNGWHYFLFGYACWFGLCRGVREQNKVAVEKKELLRLQLEKLRAESICKNPVSRK